MPRDSRHQAGLDRFKLAVEVWSTQREQEQAALEFQAGKQWPQEIAATRAGIPSSGDGSPAVPARPMLTIRSLDQPIAQIVNQARQSELAVNIVARGSKASQETAEIYEGLIRKIQTDSHAQSAYLWAYQRAVPSGFGAFRVNKQLADDGSPDDNDQELVIERILNQASVYLDPFAQDPEWRDGAWAFVTEDIPETRYKEQYSETKLARLAADDATFTSQQDQLKDWVSETDAGKCYRIAEYWFKDGNVLWWAKMNGLEFIDPPQEWDGPDIPIVPVLGNEYNVGGKRCFEGVIGPAMDSCRMLNYMVSSLAEQTGLASKVPYIGAAGQFEGFEAQWQASNTRNQPYLEYHPMTEGTGSAMLPAPERNLTSPPIDAMTTSIALFTNFIRSTTGVPDASLGHVNPNDKSGKAIQALQHAAEQGTSNYLDNLARSIKRCGEILVNLIPKLYDRPGRVVQLLAADGHQDAVMLGQPFMKGPQGPQPAQPGQMTPEGTEPQTIDLAQGKYAVVVEVSKNFATRQEQTREQMLAFAQIAPELFPRFADLVAKTLGPEGDAIAERIKPPGVDDQTNLPPAVQQQMAQMQGELQQAKQIIETKQAEKQADITIAQMNNASREKIAAMTVEADLAKTEATIDAKRSELLIKAEFERLGMTLQEKLADIRAAFQADHEGTLAAHDAAHEAGMAAEAHNRAQQLLEQTQAHEAQMGQQGHDQAIEQSEVGHQQAMEQQAAAPAPAGA